jgi:hypothetical protein
MGITILTAFAMACSNRTPAKNTQTMTIKPGNGVGPIQLGMPMDEVKKVMGAPDQIMGGKVFQYNSLGFCVLPRKGTTDVGAIMMGDMEGRSALTDAFKGTTAEGIGMKSTRQAVVTTYGQPEKTRVISEGVEELQYDAGRTCYTLKGGLVVHIVIK